jgi:hypothetical protein
VAYGEAMEGDSTPRLVSKLPPPVHNTPTPVMNIRNVRNVASGSKRKQVEIMIGRVTREGN